MPKSPAAGTGSAILSVLSVLRQAAQAARGRVDVRHVMTCYMRYRGAEKEKRERGELEQAE